MEYCTVNCGSIFIQQYSENSKFSFTVQPNLYIVKLLLFFKRLCCSFTLESMLVGNRRTFLVPV